MWNKNLKTASTGSSITPIKYFAFSPIVFAFDKLEINGTYALKGHIGKYISRAQSFS